MIPYLVWIENQLIAGKFSPDFYNNYLYSAVKEGLIGDITPVDWKCEEKQKLNALIEFPNGHCWRLEIWNMSVIALKYDFKSVAERYTRI